MKISPDKCMLGLVALGAAFVMASCDIKHTGTEITPERFYLYTSMTSHTGTDIYVWDTPLTSAHVVYRIDDFRGGSTSIRILDGSGREIFFRFLVTTDPTFWLGGNTYELRAYTDTGVAGAWRVELQYDQFTGYTDLTMN